MENDSSLKLNQMSDPQIENSTYINKNFIQKYDNQKRYELELFEGLYLNQCIMQGEAKDQLDLFYSNIYSIINSILSKTPKIEEQEQSLVSNNITKENKKNNQNNSKNEQNNKTQSSKFQNVSNKTPKKLLSTKIVPKKLKPVDDDSDSDEIPIKKKQKQEASNTTQSQPILIDEGSSLEHIEESQNLNEIKSEDVQNNQKNLQNKNIIGNQKLDDHFKDNMLDQMKQSLEDCISNQFKQESNPGEKLDKQEVENKDVNEMKDENQMQDENDLKDENKIEEEKLNINQSILNNTSIQNINIINIDNGISQNINKSINFNQSNTLENIQFVYTKQEECSPNTHTIEQFQIVEKDQIQNEIQNKQQYNSHQNNPYLYVKQEADENQNFIQQIQEENQNLISHELNKQNEGKHINKQQKSSAHNMINYPYYGNKYDTEYEDDSFESHNDTDKHHMNEEEENDDEEEDDESDDQEEEDEQEGHHHQKNKQQVMQTEEQFYTIVKKKRGRPKGKSSTSKNGIPDQKTTSQQKENGFISQKLIKLSEQLPQYFPFRQWKQKDIKDQNSKNNSKNSQNQMAQNFNIYDNVVINFNKFQSELIQQNRQFYHQCLQLFELKSPVKMGDDKFIWKFGFPYLNQSTKQQCFNDGFMSVYRDFSINYTNKSTYYLFTCIYIKEFKREYYAIIAADNLKVIHVHHDMSTLFNKFKKYMNKAEKQRNAFCYYDFVNPIEAFQNITYQLVYSSIFESLNQNPDQFGIEKKLFSDCSEILFFESIQIYLKKQLKIYNLPQGLTMGDLFFGYFDPRILLLMKLSKNQPNLKKESNTEEVKFLFNKQVIPRKNDLEQDKISPEYTVLKSLHIPSQYSAQRKFIDFENSLYEVYYGLEIKSNKKPTKKNSNRQQNMKFILIKFDDLHVSKKERKQQEFDNPESCFIFIMQKLLNNVKNISFLLDEMRALKKYPKYIRFLNKQHTFDIPEIQNHQLQIIQQLTYLSIKNIYQPMINIPIEEQSSIMVSNFFYNLLLSQEMVQIPMCQNYIYPEKIEKEIIEAFSLFYLYVSKLEISNESKQEMFQEYAKNPKKYNVIESCENKKELFLITSDITIDCSNLDVEFQQIQQKQEQIKQSLFGDSQNNCQ